MSHPRCASPALSFVVCLPLGVLPLVSPAATEHFWNPGGTGGDGVWGAGPGDLSWNTSTGAATPNYAWPDTAEDIANFQDGIGGTATIFGEVSAAGVRLNGADYTLEGGTLHLVTGSGGEQPFISVETGTLTVSAALAGNAGLIKEGAGTLVLSGTGSFTGTTALEGGTLVLAAPDQLPDGGSLVLSSGGALVLSAGVETVAGVISDGGSIDGTGTLVAATYQLNDGSTVNANLGAGVLSTSGSVALNGTTGAATVNVGAGSLSLSGGNLSDAAVLTLAAGGGVVLDGDDTVASLISNGGTISGQGTLGASTYALNDGSSVTGTLGDGAITTAGNVSISGSTGSGSLAIASGALDFTGSSAAAVVQVAAGAILQDGGDLSDAATVTNAGSLVMQGTDTVGSYVSDGGSLTGGGTLVAATYLLGDGSSVAGNLGGGVLTSQGLVSITGTSAATTVRIESGVLGLSGNNLSDTAAVNLAGGATLAISAPETVGSFTSDGGTLSGPGTLTAATHVLNHGSVVNANLAGDTVETHGSVVSGGTISASTINIVDGTLVNHGSLGNAASWIHISGGAALAAGGTETWALLTSGAGAAASWQGDLENSGTVAPGGNAGAGTLRVIGDFTNGGTLSLDVGTGGHDVLEVTGTANFGGVLEIHRLGSGEIEAMVPLQLVAAGAYAGNFTSLTEDLEGVVFFDPSNGSLTRLGSGDGAFSPGRITPNQSSTWMALYDDVIDPGARNAFYRPGQNPPFTVTSGIASLESPELLAALQASIGPAGLDAALLNRLSPEVYGSLSDYSLQALRSYHRGARTAPALAAGGRTVRQPAGGGSAKDAGSAKGGELLAPAAQGARAWEVFAAANYFDVGTSGSLGQADYDLRGAGVVAGARYSIHERFRLSAWLAGDDGRIQGDLIDADARGLAVGLGGEAYIPASGREVRISAGISYGGWEFDGTRTGAIAGGGGWSTGFSPFSDADADAFDVFVGIDSVVWSNDRIRVVPSLGLVYSSTSSDAFREAGKGAGSAVPLVVDGAGRDSLAAELGLAAAADLTPVLTLDGETGMQLGLTEETERISARFASGSRPMAAILAPLPDDFFYLGAGLTWRTGEAWRIRLGYRAEFRSDADPLNAVNLSTSVAF